MKKVIYHGANCADGFGSFLIAAEAFQGEVEGKGMVHNDPVPWDWLTKDDDLFILDFSFSREVMLNIREVVKSITVLDHHASAQANLAGLDFCVFDMDRSGVGLTWAHFHPGEPLPKMFQLIQDRDLWRYAYSETKAFSAGLAAMKKDVNSWSIILHNDPLLQELIHAGAAILQYQEQQILNIAKSAYKAQLAEFEVVMSNSPTLMSELGDHLLHQEKYADAAFAVIWVVRGDVITFSLRSKAGTANDCSKLVRRFGGGGHKHAAGFTLPLADGLKLVYPKAS